MNDKPSGSQQAADLRRRAEAHVRAHEAAQPPLLTPAQAAQLTHELRVYQVELEIQNEELRQAQASLEASQSRYFNLYDLAPVGYVTLSANGLIQEANLHIANLLGVPRAQLIQRPLGSFVCKEDQDHYYRYRQQLDSPLAATAPGASLLCELRMKRADGAPLWVRLDASRAQDGSGVPMIRVTLSDVTERKQLEDVQAFLAQHGGAVVGESFFEALASYLARTLAMDFVCIDRLEGDGLTAQTVAVWCDGKFEDNTAYALKDTPCGDVVGQAVCCFPASVCQHFPRDTVLKDLRAESYLGVTLWGHAGQPIGLIAVIGRKPLGHRPLAETILKMVTVRAAAELERLAAETELRKSEEKYRSLFDASVAAIYHFDEKKHFIDSNQAGLELLGYTREELLRLSMADVDADPPAVLPAQQQVLAGGQMILFEHKLLRKDGRVITVLNNSRPLVNAQGLVIGLQSTLLDITERKRAEEQLREKEESYHMLADSGVALIWTSGTDKKCDYFNQTWLKFTGRTLEQQLGDGWTEGVHPEDLARCFKIYAEAFDRQESFSMDYRLRRHDGEFRWIQDEGTPRHDSRGHFLGYIGHCLDITERKRAELIKEARLGLFQLAETYALNEFLRRLLDQLEALTGSRVGFYHFIEADQNTLTLQAWSTRTARELCKAEGQGRHYAVAAAGVWVDCIRARRPVVHNDYASLPHRKGLPPGHATIIRELVVPVLRGDRIMAVLGVGNKPSVYGDDDVQLVSELADLAWDLVARKQAEAALQRMHNTLVEAQKIARLGSFEYVAATRTTAWSEEEYRIYGLDLTGPSPTYDELLARHVHPDDAALLHASFTKALQSRSVYELDHRIVRPDGSVRWVHDLAYPFFDGQGELLRYVGTTMDITERKLAELALRESEERHRVVMNTMLHGLVRQRGDGIIISMNPAAERILGRTSAEFIGSSSIQEEQHTIHEDGSPFPGMEHPAMVALRTGQAICNVVMGVWNPQRKERRWIEIDAVPVFAPGQASPTEVYTVFADVTERKRAEEDLRLQGAALAAAANAIVITDTHGTIEWANPAFGTLTGYTLAETVGRKMRDLIKSGQQSAEFYKELWDTILAGHVWHGELVNLRKDGTLYTEDMTITPLRAGSNAITRFIAIKQNITERKELEKQLLRSQRLESVGRLAGGIAHDLNNILSPVLLAPPLLRTAIRDPNALGLVDLVETSTKRGAEIIKQLLTFSRGLKGERVPLQLSLLVREMRSLMRETFPKSITVRLQLPTEVPLVLGDTTQLHQVLMNLCVNARDAMPDGGELTISLEALTLDTAAAAAIPGAHAGSFVVLGVGDNGTGIAPEILEKIYDPFFTTKAVGKGSGLGLSTTLGIVRGHAGFIQVRSAPGQGTLFRVFLPASAQSFVDDGPEAAELPAEPQGHGEQVLVVDDEAHLRLTARKILEGNGYHVLEAEDGAEALSLLEKGKELPQVVLTDLLMPRMDGLTLIRALRQLPVPLKIVVMGGLPPPPETLQKLGLTEQAFIAKPFEAATLLKMLQGLLG